MKKTALILILLSLGSVFLSADALEIRRFGLFIGANNGGDARQTLLYADDDAGAMARTMRQIGGISYEDSLLLLDPSVSQIRRELRGLTSRIQEVNTLVRRSEVMFYYSGHSNETGILLSDGMISYKEIRSQLDTSGADVVIAVLDSCSSGAFTRAKGGQRRSPFLMDDSSSMEGHAFLTSSSETELSQESDSLGGSFFTHYLITGLRGAADNTRDGRVTLNEVYQHTYEETLSRTESTIGGPQHPAYDIQLTGTGDLVLTDLTVPTSALQLSGELAGRFSIRDDTDRLIAEFTKPVGDTLKMALPSGTYSIRLSNSESLYQDSEDIKTAKISLSRNAQLYLTLEDFESARGFEFTRFRGEVGEVSEGEKSFVFSILPGMDYPEIEENDLVKFQLGVLGSRAPTLSGIQIGSGWNTTLFPSEGIQGSYGWNLTRDNFRGFQYGNLFNIVQGNMEGIQYGNIFNITSQNMNGIQIGGVFNLTRESFTGIQVSGIFNIVGRPSTGIQVSGVFNQAGELKGFQASGIYNYSSYIEGTQVSVLNVAGTMRGLQIGVLNISREIYGLPLGLINLSRNGIVDMGFWFEYQEDKRIYTAFQSGTNYFYTLYYYGNTSGNYTEDTENMVWGFHIGSRLDLGPFFVDLDGGMKQSYTDVVELKNYTSVPSARALIGLDGIGLFWGVTMDFTYPHASESSMYTGKSFNLFSEDFKAYYHYVVGIKF